MNIPTLGSCTLHPSDWCIWGTHTALPLAPVRIVGIIVVSLMLRIVLHRAINAVVHRAIAGLPNPLRPLPRRLRRRLQSALPDNLSARREQRLSAVGSVLRSIVTAVIFVVALVAVLSELGINISGVVTVSSVVGVAVGFGAQTLVRDYLNGLAMLIEDQYGVGDSACASLAYATTTVSSGTSVTVRSSGSPTRARAGVARWSTSSSRTTPTSPLPVLSCRTRRSRQSPRSPWPPRCSTRPS